MVKPSSLRLLAYSVAVVLLTGCSSNAETSQNINDLLLQGNPSIVRTIESNSGETTPAKWIKNSREKADTIITSFAGAATPGSTTSGRIAAISRIFLGTPYKEFSLDQTPAEITRIDLSTFDCFLFVEQILALSHSTNSNQVESLIQQLRYRGGNVSYCNRYHYFTQWANNAEQMGFISTLPLHPSNIQTRRIKLDFMSRHSQSYLPMRNASNRQCIQQLETDLNAIQAYVPVDRLSAMQNQLKSGDIFGLVTRIKGLDVTHVGIVEVTPSSVNAIHAAPNAGVIRSQDIVRYASRVPDVIGVSFYRPTDKHMNQSHPIL